VQSVTGDWRGLTLFISNVYNMNVLEEDGDDDKQPVYVIYIINAVEYQLIYIYWLLYCSGVVAGVKWFRVIALRYYVSELPSFCRHPRHSSPPPPVHGLIYSGGGDSERVGLDGGERETVKARVFRGYNVFLRALPLDTSSAGQPPPPLPHPTTQNAQTTLVICANSLSFNSYEGGKTPPWLYK